PFLTISNSVASVIPKSFNSFSIAPWISSFLSLYTSSHLHALQNNRRANTIRSIIRLIIFHPPCSGERPCLTHLPHSVLDYRPALEKIRNYPLAPNHSCLR